jgi:hypothetical protein
MQLQWLEEQLSTGESWRKFILINHIYFGTQNKGHAVKALWNETFTREFGRIVETYSDRILIEISGHEHLADVRYSNGSVIFNNTPGANLTGPKLFHNMLIAPGVTAFDGSNPGLTTLKLDLKRHIMHDLNMHFLPIEHFYN